MLSGAFSICSKIPILITVFWTDLTCKITYIWKNQESETFSLLFLNRQWKNINYYSWSKSRAFSEYSMHFSETPFLK